MSGPGESRQDQDSPGPASQRPRSVGPDSPSPIRSVRALSRLAATGFATARQQAVRLSCGLEPFPVALVLVFCFVALANNPLVIDEKYHLAQIERFLHGDYRVPDVTTVPGYHALLALLAGVTGLVSPARVRLLSFVLSAGTLAVFFRLLRELGRDRVRLATLAFLPIVFPYLFLIYTDVFSLGLVLTSLLLSLLGRQKLAGLAGIASMLVRQSNVVWLVFLIAYGYERRHGLSLDRKAVLRHLSDYWVFLVGCGLFVIFVIVNGGVAIGDADAHPAFTLHTGNIFFLLFVFGVAFLPIVAAKLREIDLRSILYIAAGLLVYLTTFAADHPYNRYGADTFVRNWLLIFFDQDVWHRLLFYVPMGLAVHAIARCRVPLTLIVFTVLFLLPSWLIEQRYYIIPFSLFLLLVEDEREGLGLTTTWCAALSLGVFVLMEKGSRFL